MKKFFATNANTFLVLVIILALAARIVPGPRTIDDSYITFRYSRNILAGNGFVYNQGEHVLGTTTPLYTILLSLIALFSGGVNAPYPWIALIINSIADAGTCVLLFLISKRLGFKTSGYALAILWAFAPYSVTFAIGGLETSVFVFILVCTFYAFLNKRYNIAALLAGFSLVTRPDALIFIGLYTISRIFIDFPISMKQTRNMATELIYFLLPSLSWGIFAFFYFGNPIPHSMLAKSVAYILPSNSALVRLIQHFATPFLEHLTFGTTWIGIGLILYPFLFVLGFIQCWKQNKLSCIVLLYPLFYFLAYAIAHPLIFRWYLTPPLPFYFMLILFGAEKLLKDILDSSNRKIFNNKLNPQKINNLLPILLILPPLFFSAQEWTIRSDHGIDRPTPEMAYYQLELLYKKAVDRLSPEIKQNPNATLAAGDVGVLGYFTGLRILDTVGLNSPQAIQYYPLDNKYYVINYAIPPDLIMDYKPEYIVILEVYGRLGLLKDPRFQDEYVLLEKIETDMYGSDGMLIYSRRE